MRLGEIRNFDMRRGISQYTLPGTYTHETIGIEWDETNGIPDSIIYIDENGNSISSLPYNFFNEHYIWSSRWRCVRNRSTGTITYGDNARGDGLTLDGTAGDVLVRRRKFYQKFETSGNKRRMWVSAYPKTGFHVNPDFVQRGDPTAPTEADYMFRGAYEAYLVSSGNVGSASGKPPLVYTTMQNFENYAHTNLGNGGGITNPYGYAADTWLMYIEYKSFDLQTALAKGIVDRAAGTGFAGLSTGADSADTNIGTNGTGTGTGTNGLTPVVWRGIENPWGNTWEFVMGILITTDGAGTYRVIKPDGSSCNATTHTFLENVSNGTYVSGSGIYGHSAANEYTDLKTIASDDLGVTLGLPASVGASSSSYFCDSWYASQTANRILLAGGCWFYGLLAGPGCRSAIEAFAISRRNVGARLEYRQEDE